MVFYIPQRTRVLRERLIKTDPLQALKSRRRGHANITTDPAQTKVVLERFSSALPPIILEKPTLEFVFLPQSVITE